MIMKAQLKSELVYSLINEIESIVSAEDDQFLDYINDRLAWLIDEADDDEIIRNFERNFSVKHMKFLEFLPESLNGMDISRFDFGRQIILFLEFHGVSREEIRQLITDSIDRIEPSDLYLKYNEIHSWPIGETEYQIDVVDHAELKELIDQATDNELKQAEISDRESFLVYGNPCERAVWLVDPEIVCEKVQEIIAERKIK